ncbi:MAG: hypothetical protein QXN24_06510 [Candidatus Bathyarchaeia archaeon]
MKSLSALTLTVLIALIAISTLAVKQTAASNLPNNPENKADDTLHLRRDTYNNLTTAGPTNPTAANITINVRSSVTQRWVNETAVPNTWTINSGSYNFTFWISSSKKSGVHATVSFTFGYITPEGREESIASGTDTIKNVGTSIISRSITIPSVKSQTIGSGSKLFIKVTISAYGSSGDYVYFYYDGRDQPTQIITPQISSVVPEFPFGAVFLPPVLLSVYFILKKRIVKFEI